MSENSKSLEDELSKLRKENTKLKTENQILLNIKSDPRAYVREKLGQLAGVLGYEYIEMRFAIGLSEKGLPEMVNYDYNLKGVDHFQIISMVTSKGVWEGVKATPSRIMNEEHGIADKKLGPNHFTATQECVEKNIELGYLPKSSLENLLPKNEQDPKFIKDRDENFKATGIYTETIPQLYEQFAIPIYANPERTKLSGVVTMTLKTKDEISFKHPISGEVITLHPDKEFPEEVQKYYEEQIQDEYLGVAFEALKKEISLDTSNSLLLNKNTALEEALHRERELKDQTIQQKLELEKAYEELDEKKEREKRLQLIAASQAFNFGIKHELNQSLSGLNNNLYLLLADPEIRKVISSDQKYSHLVTDISESTKKITEKISYIKEGEEETRFESVNLKKVVDEAIKDYKDRISFNVSVDDSLFVDWTYDSAVLVLGNLLKNAEEALEKKDQKKIDIYAKRSNNEIILGVRDYGCGMDEKTQSEAFIPGKSTKGVGSGSRHRGQGLFFVLNSVYAAKGDVSIDSKLGEYTDISINFKKD